MGRLLTLDEWKRKANIKHNNKYDYSKVEYKNANTKVCIICPTHGEFWQKPGMHLFGNGCPKCNKSFKMNTNAFIEKAKQIYGSKYDYSKVDYKGNKNKVCIICPTHGEFWQRPNDHLNGHGCYKCNCHNHTKNFSNFIEKANKIHLGKYEYVSDTYLNREKKIKIICPEHGEFWQKPVYHLQGNGCPLCGHKCNVSEQKIFNTLKEYFGNEEILYQYRNSKLLGMMSFDIYMPKYKIAIEHQGIQHFEAVKRFGGIERLELIKERDKEKRNICKKNGIHMLYISLYNDVIKYSTEEYYIISSIEELIKKIENIILDYEREVCIN